MSWQCGNELSEAIHSLEQGLQPMLAFYATSLLMDPDHTPQMRVELCMRMPGCLAGENRMQRVPDNDPQVWCKP